MEVVPNRGHLLRTTDPFLSLGAEKRQAWWWTGVVTQRVVSRSSENEHEQPAPKPMGGEEYDAGPTVSTKPRQWSLVVRAEQHDQTSCCLVPAGGYQANAACPAGPHRQPLTGAVVIVRSHRTVTHALKTITEKERKCRGVLHSVYILTGIHRGPKA